jgi:hypothetical protein
MALTTARRSVVRGRPPGRAAGSYAQAASGACYHGNFRLGVRSTVTSRPGKTVVSGFELHRVLYRPFEEKGITTFTYAADRERPLPTHGIALL